jgi:hypothetical protein
MWQFIIFLLLFSFKMALASGNHDIKINGYGTWMWGGTDGNRYRSADEDGNFDFSQFSLNVAASPYKRTNIYSQVNFRLLPGKDWESTLNYAFVEYVFSDLAALRIGKVKLPFGAYTEIIEVGVLRPFLDLPESNYGVSGMIGNSCLGLAMTGNYSLDGAWDLQYDFYIGQLQLTKFYQRDFDFRTQTFVENEKRNLIDNAFGGRFLLSTPLDGLQFSLASYLGNPVKFINGLPTDGDEIHNIHQAINAHAEYQVDKFTLRSEYQYMAKIHGEDVTFEGLYGEFVWNFLGPFEFVAQLNSAVVNFNTSFARYLDEMDRKHSESAFGLNYWFNPGFVLKASYHLIEGNLYSHYEWPDTKPRTRAVFIGTQFSF